MILYLCVKMQVLSLGRLSIQILYEISFLACASRHRFTNSSWNRMSDVSSGWKDVAIKFPWATATTFAEGPKPGSSPSCTVALAGSGGRISSGTVARISSSEVSEGMME
jgi:hypothetical protein